MPMLRSIAPTTEKPDPDYRSASFARSTSQKARNPKSLNETTRNGRYASSIWSPRITPSIQQEAARTVADEVSAGSGLLPPHFPSKPKTTLSGTFAPFSHPMAVQERGHLRPSQGDSSWHSFGSPAYSQLCCSRPYQCLPDTGFRKTRFYLFFFPAAEHLVLRRLRHGAISVERSGADNL